MACGARIGGDRTHVKLVRTTSPGGQAMFKNVIVGMDGRGGGRDAIALATQLLDGEGKLTLAHVRQGPTNPYHAIAPGLLDAYRELGNPLEKLGVAYNGSPESEDALDLARELGRETGARVSALEVVHLSAYAFGGLVAAPPMGDAIEEMLGHAEARMRALTGVEGRAGYGLPGEDLAAFSDDVDLLIVGSRSYGPV